MNYAASLMLLFCSVLFGINAEDQKITLFVEKHNESNVLLYIITYKDDKRDSVSALLPCSWSNNEAEGVFSDAAKSKNYKDRYYTVDGTYEYSSEKSMYILKANFSSIEKLNIGSAQILEEMVRAYNLSK